MLRLRKKGLYFGLGITFSACFAASSIVPNFPRRSPSAEVNSNVARPGSRGSSISVIAAFAVATSSVRDASAIDDPRELLKVLKKNKDVPKNLPKGK